MGNRVFVSKVDPSVGITLDDAVREHLRRHFDGDLPGSKFYAQSVEELLQVALDRFPHAIASAQPDDDDIKVVSLQFEKEIGTSNVVPINMLTPEELSTMQVVPRGETMARSVISNRMFPTRLCQLILDGDNRLITAYPGEAAPPLPPTPDIHDPYWDNHVFIQVGLI